MEETLDKYECPHCGRAFVRERTLFNHMCEKKRRWNNRDEKYVKIGFDAWRTFYQKTGSSKTADLTYKKFMNSKYYIAFVKFGKHVLDTKLINPKLFIDFVIKNNVKLDDWCKTSVYEEYVRDVCRREDIHTALERQANLIEKWSEETGEEWSDFFKKLQPGLAYKWIVSGRLSPWVLFVGKSAEKYLFPCFNDEQFLHIADFVNFDYWRVKVAHNNEDASIVKEFLEKCGL